MMQSMTKEDFQFVRGFVNALANLCRECTRRSQERCSQCELRNVMRVLAIIDRSQGKVSHEDTSAVAVFAGRLKKILRRVREVGICRSAQIDLGEGSSAQNKFFALDHLVRRGYLRIVTNAAGYRAYEIVPSQRENVNRIIGS